MCVYTQYISHMYMIYILHKDAIYNVYMCDIIYDIYMGVGSGGSWDHLIDPAWWVHLQFEIFSVPTSGPKAAVCAVLTAGKCI